MPSASRAIACSPACRDPAPTAWSSTSEHEGVIRVSISPTAPTVTATDPFSSEVLEDPAAFHAWLRGAGPVVHLSRHDVHAMGRYEQVRAALLDWQGFQSAAGVGLSNFRHEKPWRP